MKHIPTFEQFIYEAKMNLGLSTNEYPSGTMARYRLESSVINLRKVVNLSKESWAKYAKPFTDNEIGFDSGSDRRTAMAAIQKSFDNGYNDMREFGLNESVVSEEYDVSGLSRTALKSILNYLDANDISYDFDGPNEILDFDITELDRKGQEQLKKLGLAESVINESDINLKNISDIDHTRLIKWIHQNLKSDINVVKSKDGFIIDVSKIPGRDKNDLMKYLKSNDYLNESEEVNEAIEIVYYSEVLDNWGRTESSEKPDVITKVLQTSDEWTDDMWFEDKGGKRYDIDDLIGKQVKVGNKSFTIKESEMFNE